MSKTLDCMMLIGLPGSGKSTWRADYLSKLGANAENWVIASSDDLIDQWAEARGLTYSEAWDKVPQKDIQNQFKQQIKDAVADGKNLIIDRTNMSGKARRGLLKMLDERYNKTAVVFVVPDNVLKERLESRAKATGKHIPAFVVTNMARSYEAPTREEFDKIIRV